jgi:mono/diheme cytochrome c family protein
MQRYGLGVIVVWWTLLGMALAAEQRPSIPDETERVGQQYFVRYCSACHGVEGRGDGPAAPVLQPPPAISRASPGGVGGTSRSTRSGRIWRVLKVGLFRTFGA